jgi:hypothetical protein
MQIPECVFKLIYDRLALLDNWLRRVDPERRDKFMLDAAAEKTVLEMFLSKNGRIPTP